MKKLITNIAIASITLASQAQENTETQKDTTQSKLHTNMVGYIDFAEQKQTSDITKYQYASNGINHVIVGFKGNFGKQKNGNFSLLGQTGGYVNSNYTNKDSIFTKYIHDANISRQFNQKDSSFIKIEGGIFGGSPIGQANIIPISFPDSISAQKPPINIINNIIQQSRTQLSENTPYYITGLFITKHQDKWDIKLGVTNGAQHILDNNNKAGGFASLQYTTSSDNQFYICYHISDEGTITRNLQHIGQAHGIIHIGDIYLIPSAYININKNTSIYGANIGASLPINKTTKIALIGEFNKNTEKDIFPNQYYGKTIIELQKILINSEKNNMIISSYIGLDNKEDKGNICAGISIKMSFSEKIK